MAGALTRMRTWLLDWANGPVSTYQKWVMDFSDRIYDVVPGLTIGGTYEPDPINYPGVYMPIPSAIGEQEGEIYLSDDLTPSQTWIWQAGAWNGMSAAAGVGTSQFVFRGKYDEDVEDPGKFREVIGAPFPTSIIWWETPAKLAKVKEITIVRDGNQLPQIVVWKFYVAGVLQKTYTDNIVYSGVFETSRQRSIT